MNDGGPAFPHAYTYETGFDGMSLRDYFAAAVIGHLLPSFGSGANMHALAEGAQTLAELSFHLADAMLAERSNP